MCQKSNEKRLLIYAWIEQEPNVQLNFNKTAAVSGTL